MRTKRREKHMVWLHIGMPKTGTTSIQSTLFSNRNLLASHGYFYPDFGYLQHIALVRRLSRKAGSKVPIPKKGDCGRYPLHKAMLADQNRTLHTSIISSEYFFQRPACMPGYQADTDQDPFEILGNTIRLTAEYFSGCDVRVLIWLRRQDRWLMSMYNQTIKSSLYSEDFSVFSEKNIGTQMFQIVQMWADAFGKDSISLRSYDTIVQNGMNGIDSFLDNVCPDVPRTEFRRSESDQNRSLSNEALWLKRKINILIKKQGAGPISARQNRARALLARITNSSPAPNASLLTNPQRLELMDQYIQSNQELIREFGSTDLDSIVNLQDLITPSPTQDSQQSSSVVDMYTHLIEQFIREYVVLGRKN